MKTKGIIFLFILISATISSQDLFYYYKGDKIYLEVDKNFINVINIEKSQVFSPSILSEFNFELSNSDSKNLKLAFKSTPSDLEYIRTVNALEKANVKVFPYFKRKGKSSPISISHVFYVKIKESSDLFLLNNLLEENNVQLVRQVKYMPLWYILSISGSKFKNTIEAANFFYETNLFADVDPAFMFNFKQNCATNDPMFNLLWGFHNVTNPGVDINVCDAWKITKGAEVSIAIFDNGIDKTHNDLSPNISPLSFNAKYGTSPSNSNPSDSHGTHVAGIAASVGNNNLQVIVVAPESKIIDISHDFAPDGDTFSAELASGISWAWQHNVDVINNSWGDQGGVDHNYFNSPILEESIIDAITKGRSGKGCIVVFSSGNYGDIDYPGYIDPRILTVGAISPSGKKASFSAYGKDLDVVAPGVGIYSTVLANGVDSMRGTSMAAPHVSGVAALVLSINPALTGSQVVDIIESTAQKINSGPHLGQYNYQVTADRHNGTWHEEMGYGLVDAYKAVQTACPPMMIDNQMFFFNEIKKSCCKIEISNSTIEPYANLVVSSSASITLLPGFHVKAGGAFEARIDTCSPPSDTPYPPWYANSFSSPDSTDPSNQSMMFEEIIVDFVGDAQLFQNIPNPSRGSTVIPFNIPFNAADAHLNIVDMTGIVIKKISLIERGSGKIEIETSGLHKGLYIYSLIIDGKVAGTKKMQVL